MERTCKNCWNADETNDYSCDLGFFESENCTHHKFLEGLGKDIDVVSCGNFNGEGEGVYIVERDKDGNIVRYIWFLNTGEDDYYNFSVGMWEKGASKTGTFKMSIKPEDEEGLFYALSEFYDLSISKIFDSVDFLGFNRMSIEKDDEKITLSFSKGPSFLDTVDSVEVYLGDCFTCTEYDSFLYLYQSFGNSYINEDRKTVEKLLALKNSFV